MSLEAPDDPHIQGLYKWGHVWLKAQELNISRFILNIVTRKVVEGEADASVLITHLDIQLFDIPAIYNWPSFRFEGTNAYSSNSSNIIQAFLLFR